MESDAESPRILVVDDSRLMRRAIIKILGNKYDIVEAVDGEDGWNKLSSDDSVQIVISDLSMPNLDGFGFLDVIRNSEIPHIKQIPVIIITGAEDDEAVKEKALSHGATDFITKPFDSAQLNARVATHARLSKTTRELDKASQDLKTLSGVDSLTKLANKQGFSEQAIKDFAFSKRHGHPMTILRMDIDGFNTLFIRYGKEFSGRLLVKLAEILKGLTRTEDTVARIGVAKFALLLPSTAPDGGKVLAQRVLDSIRKQDISVNGENVPIAASIGMSSLYVTPDSSLETVFIATEKNLLSAINNGGNCIVMDEPMPGYDDALSMIEKGEHEKLDPFLGAMIQKLLPLLEHYNKRMHAGLDSFIIKLKGGNVPEDAD